MITDCLNPTNVNSLPILAGITPSDIRRAVASRTERTRQATDERHPLNWHLGMVPRLKSRNSFIKCTQPINTRVKAARMERTTRAPGRLCATMLTNTFQLAPRTSTGCVDTSWPVKSEHVKVGVFKRTMHLWLWHQTDHATYTCPIHVNLNKTVFYVSQVNIFCLLSCIRMFMAY